MEGFSIKGDDIAPPCGHYHSVEAWQASLDKLFVAGPRKAPLFALKCLSCKETLALPFLRKVGSQAFLTELEAVLRTIPKTTNPSSLDDFNYTFDDKGSLITKDGTTFHYVSETHYSRLGDMVTTEIQNRMKSLHNMKEVLLPDSEAPHTSNVFHSENLTSADRIVLLIQGSGAVRAGQWARALCLNASLNEGSILPYLQRLHARGIAVVVFNPNLNHHLDIEDLSARDPFAYWTNPSKTVDLPVKSRHRIPGSSSPEEHCASVVDALVKSSKAPLSIIAHSYGGVCTLALLKQRPELLQRVQCVAFTDAVHSAGMASSAIRTFLKERAINWVQSHEALDTPCPEQDGHSGCQCVSAGSPQHEYTSYAAIDSVFRFLDERFK